MLVKASSTGRGVKVLITNNSGFNLRLTLPPVLLNNANCELKGLPETIKAKSIGGFFLEVPRELIRSLCKKTSADRFFNKFFEGESVEVALLFDLESDTALFQANGMTPKLLVAVSRKNEQENLYFSQIILNEQGIGTGESSSQISGQMQSNLILKKIAQENLWTNIIPKVEVNNLRLSHSGLIKNGNIAECNLILEPILSRVNATNLPTTNLRFSRPSKLSQNAAEGHFIPNPIMPEGLPGDI